MISVDCKTCSYKTCSFSSFVMISFLEDHNEGNGYHLSQCTKFDAPMHKKNGLDQLPIPFVFKYPEILLHYLF